MWMARQKHQKKNKFKKQNSKNKVVNQSSNVRMMDNILLRLPFKICLRIQVDQLNYLLSSNLSNYFRNNPR